MPWKWFIIICLVPKFIMGPTITKNQKQIEILQNRAVWKITFKKHFDWTDPLYKELNVLKFHIVPLQNYLFMNQMEHDRKLAKNFPILKHCDIITAY